MSDLMSVQRVKQLITALFEAIAQRVDGELSLKDQWAQATESERVRLEQSLQARTEKYGAERAAIQTEYDEACAVVGRHFHAHHSAASEEYDEALLATNREYEEATTTARQEFDETKWMVMSYFDETSAGTPKQQFEQFETNIASTQQHLETEWAQLQQTRIELENVLKKRRMWTEGDPIKPTAAPTSPTLDTFVEIFSSNAASLRQHATNVKNKSLPFFFAGVMPVLVFLIAAGAVTALALATVDPRWLRFQNKPPQGEWTAIMAVGSAILTIAVQWILYAIAHSSAESDCEKLQQFTVEIEHAKNNWSKLSLRETKRRRKEFEDWLSELVGERDAALQKAQDKLDRTLSEATSKRMGELKVSNDRYPRLMQNLTKERDDKLAALHADYPERLNKLKGRFEWDLDKLQRDSQRSQDGLRQTFDINWQALSTNWFGAIDSIQASIERLNAQASPVSRSWNDLAFGSWTRPDAIPSAMRLGELRFSLHDIEHGYPTDEQLVPEASDFVIPALQPFPERTSLLVRATGSQGRATAVKLLQVAMLRLLTTLPPGKLRFTIIDPIGLGQDFSAFMHLADFDELLITKRIWTEATHIDQRLADLTEHMETVFQTYLRNEFKTIEEYNDFAGEVAEPYHVLVIAGFPANFSEQAGRRLTSIMTSGPKCGLYTLISADAELSMPPNFQLEAIESNATCVTVLPAGWDSSTTHSVGSDSTTTNPQLDIASVSSASDFNMSQMDGSNSNSDLNLNRNPNSVPQVANSKALIADGSRWNRNLRAAFLYDDPELNWLPLQLDLLPEPEAYGRIVKKVGDASKDARRVEVSFDRVAPKTLWQSDSRGGLDVPLGRAGATKLQHMRLGKGTSQHVLVAGKTGSGKSTLMHILITNLALHYSPDEVEFYLIDFKKGVEFKTYAAHGLPHARVIAIESDREFGMSVLERLDQVLKERGDLFRDQGVQDIAGFRNANPGQRMPRLLLLVDEFQEFFVEDDKLSQNSALLMDRLVRQGRAFGIHVLLGSQTLGGAYSLARSTLGQVAVRIALQCSESDAHLILSEDNTAARLLTRPGEAIYNDANGLLEGNHPFQIAWLEDSKRDVFLDRVKDLTDERGLDVQPPIVFEGNIPANPLNNTEISSLLKGSIPVSFPKVIDAWLGEAVAIKPHTTVRFRRLSGSNLLIVGQSPQSARGILSTLMLSLALQVPPILDLGGQCVDGPHSDDELDDSDAVAANSSATQVAKSTEAAPQSNPAAALDALKNFSFSNFSFSGESTSAPTSTTSPAASHLAPNDGINAAQFYVLNGDLADDPDHNDWESLTENLPHQIRHGGPREAADIVAKLSAIVRQRSSVQGDAEPPIFLLIDNLGRFRDLRKGDDEYSFGSSAKNASTPAKQFTDLLKDGPAVGVHALIWCDTYNNLGRWLASGTLKELEMRVAFQMSATDSSNLIDTPAAAKLGPNRAILFLEEHGSTEKFRPYGLLSDETQQQLSAHFTIPEAMCVLDEDVFEEDDVDDDQDDEDENIEISETPTAVEAALSHEDDAPDGMLCEDLKPFTIV